MRHIVGLSLSFALLLAGAGPVVAGDRETALALIDQAIKAHGGEAALARTQTMHRTSTGTMILVDKRMPFRKETTVQLPSRYRSDTTIEENGRKIRVLIVVNGNRGWQSAGGAVTELTKERLAEKREEAQVQWLATLLPLKKESGIELAPLPEIKVNDQPAAGVKVSRNGHADVRFYFDRKSGLLVKLECKVQEAGLAIARESLFSEYKHFDGVMLPVKVLERMNGKIFVEVGSCSYKLSEKVDDSVFAKP